MRRLLRNRKRYTLEWKLAGPPPPKCGAKRGPKSRTYCERPPHEDDGHIGRSPAGLWFSWGGKYADS